jgi:hypothetical protein
MLFTCLPPGARIPGRFPGPRRARGKWFTIDIHCHVHFPKADEMVKPFWNPERDATMKFANARTREVQRQQMERTHSQLTSVEQRLADMDVMGIDIQAICPAPVQMFYWTEPDLGIAAARAVNDNIADIVARHPDRFVGMGTVPFQAPELAVAELDRLGYEVTNEVIDAASWVPQHRERTFIIGLRREIFGGQRFVFPPTPASATHSRRGQPLPAKAQVALRLYWRSKASKFA